MFVYFIKDRNVFTNVRYNIIFLFFANAVGIFNKYEIIIKNINNRIMRKSASRTARVAGWSRKRGMSPRS